MKDRKQLGMLMLTTHKEQVIVIRDRKTGDEVELHPMVSPERLKRIGIRCSKERYEIYRVSAAERRPQ